MKISPLPIMALATTEHFSINQSEYKPQGVQFIVPSTSSSPTDPIDQTFGHFISNQLSNDLWSAFDAGQPSVTGARGERHLAEI